MSTNEKQGPWWWEFRKTERPSGHGRDISRGESIHGKFNVVSVKTPEGVRSYAVDGHGRFIGMNLGRKASLLELISVASTSSAEDYYHLALNSLSNLNRSYIHPSMFAAALPFKDVSDATLVNFLHTVTGQLDSLREQLKDLAGQVEVLKNPQQQAPAVEPDYVDPILFEMGVFKDQADYNRSTDAFISRIQSGEANRHEPGEDDQAE